MNEIPAAFLFLCAAVAAMLIALLAGLRRQFVDARRPRSRVAGDPAPGTASDRESAGAIVPGPGRRCRTFWRAIRLAATLALLAVMLLCAGLLLQMVRGS